MWTNTLFYPCSGLFVLPDLHRLLREGLEHGFIGGNLSHGIGAVWENLVLRAGMAALVSNEGSYHLTGSVGGAANLYRVPAAVDNLKGDAGEAGIALGSLSGLAVPLLHSNATPNHVITRL